MVSSTSFIYHAYYCAGGNAYQKMREVQSSGGKLDLTLSVEMGSFQLDWFTIQRRTYNGSSRELISAPTWRIRPGDNISLTLVRCL